MIRIRNRNIGGQLICQSESGGSCIFFTHRWFRGGELSATPISQNKNYNPFTRARVYNVPPPGTNDVLKREERARQR